MFTQCSIQLRNNFVPSHRLLSISHLCAEFFDLIFQPPFHPFEHSFDLGFHRPRHTVDTDHPVGAISDWQSLSRDPFRLPIMCSGLHPPHSAGVKQFQLSADFLSSWKTVPRWCFSCFSLVSPRQGAQIGVYIDRFDAKCRRPGSAFVASSKT